MSIPGIEMNIFSHHQHSEHVWVITEGCSYIHRFTMGLVVGNEKLVLIDTGMGFTPDLRKYIEHFFGSDKPITTVISHGAVDHAASAMLFDEAYLHRFEQARREGAFGNPARRLKDLPWFAIQNPETIDYMTRKVLNNRDFKDFKDIHDGDIIDCAPVTVRAIATPGHTIGHFSYFIPEEKVAFACDAINTHGSVNPHVNFNLPEVREEFYDILKIPVDAPRLTMQQAYGKYADVIRHFIDVVGRDSVFYSGHMNIPMPIDIAESYIQCCEELRDGKVEGDCPGESIFGWGKNAVTGVDRKMHYNGNVGLEYDANLLDKNRK